MFTQRTTSCDHRCGVFGAKVVVPAVPSASFMQDAGYGLPRTPTSSTLLGE